MIFLGRRKQAINPRDFWPVTPKHRSHADIWFKKLAGSVTDRGSVHSFSPYALLLKRVPIFNKKEEILVALRENDVPAPRAVWYVKITMAYAAAMTETNKTKKRQASDPCQEWTHTLTR